MTSARKRWMTMMARRVHTVWREAHAMGGGEIHQSEAVQIASSLSYFFNLVFALPVGYIGIVLQY
jgi:hypothetical protein